MTRSVKIFYCYAHEDKVLRDQLEKHLGPLKREGQIKEWHDREILPGVDWEHEIEVHLNESDIVLLLVSPDFMYSNYCYGIEMKRALEKHEARKVRVLPIILRPVDWERTPIGKLQVLPTGAKPVTVWSSRDEAFLDVVKGIRRVVEEVLSHSSTLQNETSSFSRKYSRIPAPPSLPSTRQHIEEDVDEGYYDVYEYEPEQEHEENISPPPPMRIGTNSIPTRYSRPSSTHARRTPVPSSSTHARRTPVSSSSTHARRTPVPSSSTPVRTTTVRRISNVPLSTRNFWVHIFLPLSAYMVREAIVFCITESLLIAILLGIGYKSLWAFGINLLISYLLLNLGANVENFDIRICVAGTQSALWLYMINAFIPFPSNPTLYVNITLGTIAFIILFINLYFLYKYGKNSKH